MLLSIMYAKVIILLYLAEYKMYIQCLIWKKCLVKIKQCITEIIANDAVGASSYQE